MSYKKKHLPSIRQTQGSPFPLGVSKQENGINFALFSQHAQAITLHLFQRGSTIPFAQFSLDPLQNKTGWIWHICLTLSSAQEMEYVYQIEGDRKDPLNHFSPQHLLCDPYALGLNTSHLWGKTSALAPRGKILFPKAFDWEETPSPKIPLEDLILYELHVRHFTAHPSSRTRDRGTFLALIEKIPYLKSLGINAIELMPIFEFNENEMHRKHPKTHEPLKNTWGYSPINFFSPMNRYASSDSWTSAIDDFRSLVKEMHKNGIEVYLDVVYNHTAEGGKRGPRLSFKGIDNQVYYLLGPQGEYLNFSGTGNTFNANHPVVAELILNSLRYWVKEMHVDGFRFDLASCLTRGRKGKPSAHPLLIQMITDDPLLANTKLIAEAWDAAGLYQVGHFPGNGRWLEWNGVYRDSVRRFIKGTDHQAGAFAKALCGSQDLFGHDRTPCHSVNFITAHDGFTLHDLVSYQHKHNLDNAEHNQDGGSDNNSWNCGHEGPSKNPEILTLRQRQMRNFHVALMVSIGTPMLFMGDEYGHTKKGNNNTYCQEEPNWFIWSQLTDDPGWTRFYRLMIHLRKKYPIFRRSHFLTDKDIHWHGLKPLHANWAKENRLLAYTLFNSTKKSAFYIAFNAHFVPAFLHLPPPPKNSQWHRVVDTSLPSPEDFLEHPQKTAALSGTYSLPAYSALIAISLGVTE